jgi:hypothetical protein
MKFQIGEIRLDSVTAQSIIHPNRTRKYLLPCLREYGEEFTTKLNNAFKVAVGLGDMIITNRYYKSPERHVFILFNTKIASEHFTNLLEYVKDQEYFEDDYAYGNLQKTNLHMIVIKFPQKYWDSFDTFKIGKYSEMFTKEVIDSMFIRKDDDTPKILIKDHKYKIRFTRRLNRLFGTNLEADDYDGELDLPPNEREETFNT